MLFGYLLLLLLSFVLISFNYRIQNTNYTASNLLIIPYLIVIFIQVIACYVMQLESISIDYWMYNLVFFLVAFFADNLGYFTCKKIIYSNRYERKIERKYNVATIKLLSLLSIIYLLVFLFVQMMRMSNIYFLVQEEIQNTYTSGLNYYLRLWLMIASVYFLGCSNLSKTNILWGIACLIPNVLTFVKSIVILICFASLIIRLKNREVNVSVKTGIMIVAIFLLGFFGINLVELGIYDLDLLFKAETYKTVVAKFVFYFISGVQGFSQNLNGNINAFGYLDNVTLAPFYNFLAKLGIGHSISPVTTIDQKLWFSPVLGKYVYSNVNGYIGTLFLFNGLWGGSLLNFFWIYLTSILNNYLTNKNSVLYPCSALFCAALALGWFDYYFSQTLWAYLLLIAVFINYASRFRIVYRSESVK